MLFPLISIDFPWLFLDHFFFFIPRIVLISFSSVRDINELI